MNVTEILTGVISLVASFFALRLALPGSDGKVQRWLGGDTGQSFYAMFVLVLAAFGISQIVTGVVP